MERVPDDLIYEILCRVRVKYLLRCRCVSKNWRSLIDSTYFVEKHYKTSLECNSGGIIIHRRGKYYLANYESFHDDVCTAIKINDYLKNFDVDTELVGCARGLVCLSTESVKKIVLLNPSTKKCTKLPQEPAKLSKSFYKYKIQVSLCGFGYDHVSDDYKVVKVKVRYHPFYDIMVLVYSLKNNSWTRLQNVCLSRKLCFEQNWGTFASGALYWSTLAAKEVDISCIIIVRFDLGLEQFTEVVDSVPGEDYLCSERLVAFGGSLHILDYRCIDYDIHADVSQIKDFGMKNSRSKVFSVNGGEFVGFCGIRPLAYSKSHQEVLIQTDYTYLMWYHLQSETLRKVHGIPNSLNSHSYTESLFPVHPGIVICRNHYMRQNQRNN